MNLDTHPPSAVFPVPQQIEPVPGAIFRLDESCPVLVPERPSAQDLFLARFLIAEVSDRFGLGLQIRQATEIPAGGRAIAIGAADNPLIEAWRAERGTDLSPDSPGPEGYVALRQK